MLAVDHDAGVIIGPGCCSQSITAAFEYKQAAYVTSNITESIQSSVYEMDSSIYHFLDAEDHYSPSFSSESEESMVSYDRFVQDEEHNVDNVFT